MISPRGSIIQRKYNQQNKPKQTRDDVSAYETAEPTSSDRTRLRCCFRQWQFRYDHEVLLKAGFRTQTRCDREGMPHRHPFLDKNRSSDKCVLCLTQDSVLMELHISSKARSFVSVGFPLFTFLPIQSVQILAAASTLPC